MTDTTEGQDDKHEPGSTDALLDTFIQETDRAEGSPQPNVPGQTPADGQGTARPPQGQGPDTRATGQGRDTQQQPAARGPGDGAPAPVQQVPQAARQYGRLFLADQRGDIYDAQGQLITKQGYGRTVFHKLYPYIEATTTENASLRQRVEAYENANAVAKQNGLTIDDHSAAMQLMVNWKKNPSETINTLLRVAQDRGIDVSAIRGGGFDPAALSSQLDQLMEKKLERFAPFIQQEQQRAHDAELNDRVATEYNTFMQEFPDATPHQDSIANVMRDHNMTPREAYFAVRALAAQQQLDWTQPLAPQMIARQSGNGQQPPGPGNGRALPNMNGRGNGSDTVEAGSRNVPSAEESWDSILRRTFKQHGIDIQ
ncbi:MAG TPA: hypothetical protein VNS88_03825 [Nitrospiraceae bacterium]|nr:hypothetical protein [Nitrospiraceae bacterium]